MEAIFLPGLQNRATAGRFVIVARRMALKQKGTATTVPLRTIDCDDANVRPCLPLQC